MGLSTVVEKAVAQTLLSTGGKLAARAALNGLGSTALGAADAAIRNSLGCEEKDVGEAAFLSGLFGAAGSVFGDVAQGAIDQLATGNPGSFAKNLIDSGQLSGGWNLPFSPQPGAISSAITGGLISSSP